MKPTEDYTSRIQSLIKSYSELYLYNHTVLYIAVAPPNDYFTQKAFQVLIFLEYAQLVLMKMQIDQNGVFSIIISGKKF